MEEVTKSPARMNRPVVLSLRVMHGFIAAVMLCSTGVVYYSGVTRTYNVWLYLAAAALLAEGVAVVWNRGDCPLTDVSRRYGDTKAFFELFLPERVARQMFKVNGVVIGAGVVILLVGLLV